MGGITGREGRFTPADCRLRVFNRSGDKPPFLTCDPSIFQAEIELLLPDRALAPLSFYVKEAPRCSLPVRRSKDEKMFQLMVVSLAIVALTNQAFAQQQDTVRAKNPLVRLLQSKGIIT